MDKITLNGEPRTVPSGQTVGDLLRALGMDPSRVVVEQNRIVHSQEVFEQVRLADGDVVEILRFMGGG